ncbi:hypothetical protein Pelo_2551 [Pelomyxa schiedti]|nr:hypothetical protein Pelo_2551 [Pelomyxa schiedti]
MFPWHPTKGIPKRCKPGAGFRWSHKNDIRSDEWWCLREWLVIKNFLKVVVYEDKLLCQSTVKSIAVGVVHITFPGEDPLTPQSNIANSERNGEIAKDASQYLVSSARGNLLDTGSRPRFIHWGYFSATNPQLHDCHKLKRPADGSDSTPHSTRVYAAPLPFFAVCVTAPKFRVFHFGVSPLTLGVSAEPREVYVKHIQCCKATSADPSHIIFVKKELLSHSRARCIHVLETDNHIITKTMAYLLNPLIAQLCHPNQNGFFEGRLIDDNITAVANAFYTLKNHNVAAQFLFTDFSKAYDNLDRNTIIHILGHVGMPQSWTNVITHLMQDTEAHLPSGIHIPLRRGVRQGCPLSPLIFNEVLEVPPGSADIICIS